MIPFIQSPKIGKIKHALRNMEKGRGVLKRMITPGVRIVVVLPLGQRGGYISQLFKRQ